MNNSRKKPLDVWALTDDIAGHNAQALGVAEALDYSYRKKKLVYNNKAKYSFILNGLKIINRKSSDVISKPWPDVVVSCGRKSASVALAIKKKAKKDGKKVFVACIMWPGLSFFKFDLAAVPEHDVVLWPTSASKKLFRTLGAPNRLTKNFLMQEYRIWAKTIGDFPSPRLVVLVGGNSRKTSFTLDHAKELCDLVVNAAGKTKASVFVSTSRRTSEEVCDYIEENLSRRIGRNFYFHNYNKTRANPFYAFLQLANVIFASGDSISMCSEACSTGKPVFIFSPEGNAPEKHRRLHDTLFKKNYARALNEDSIIEIERILSGEGLYGRNLNVLSTAEDIAKEIRNRIEKNN